jgi:hypothetical protein
MDLLKTVIANRQSAGVAPAPVPPRRTGRKPPTKAERAKENTPGSKSMRQFIIAEKPGKKVVREHLEAIIARECESSSDGE